jgi:YD repeat-containing protein
MANAAKVATSKGDDAGRHRDHERIAHLPPEMVEVVMLLLEHDGEIVERRVVRPQIAGECRVFGRDREQHHVVDRRDRPQQHRNADQQQLGFGRDGAQRGQAHFDNRLIMK